MTSIKSEDGLTHDWDRSNTDEWHAATRTDVRGIVQLVALVIGAVGVIIAATISAPSAPVVIPMLLASVILYTTTLTSGRSDR